MGETAGAAAAEEAADDEVDDGTKTNHVDRRDGARSRDSGGCEGERRSDTAEKNATIRIQRAVQRQSTMKRQQVCSAQRLYYDCWKRVSSFVSLDLL